MYVYDDDVEELCQRRRITSVFTILDLEDLVRKKRQEERKKVQFEIACELRQALENMTAVLRRLDSEE